MYRSGMGGMERDFGHSDMPMNRGFADSFGGMGKWFPESSHAGRADTVLVMPVPLCSLLLCLLRGYCSWGVI